MGEVEKDRGAAHSGVGSVAGSAVVAVAVALVCVVVLSVSPLVLAIGFVVVLWLFAGAALVLGRDDTGRPDGQLSEVSSARHLVPTAERARDERTCDQLVYELHQRRLAQQRGASHGEPAHRRTDVALVREGIVSELRLRQQEAHCRLCGNISPVFLMASLLEESGAAWGQLRTVRGEG